MITPGRLVLVPACLVLTVTMSGCGGDATVAPKAAAASSSATPSISPTPSSSPTPSTSPTPSVDQAAAVAVALNRYKAAALAKDGAAAANLLADTTSSFYNEARNAALTATKQELAALDPVTKLTALVMRGSLPVGVLRSSTPKELVAAAVDAGLIGADGIRNVTIGKVTVSGDTARSAVIVRGTVAPFMFGFVRQEGQWKVDLLPILHVLRVSLKEAATQQGMTVNQLIDANLTQKYGRARYGRLVSRPLGR